MTSYSIAMAILKCTLFMTRKRLILVLLAEDHDSDSSEGHSEKLGQAPAHTPDFES